MRKGYVRRGVSKGGVEGGWQGSGRAWQGQKKVNFCPFGVHSGPQRGSRRRVELRRRPFLDSANGTPPAMCSMPSRQYDSVCPLWATSYCRFAACVTCEMYGVVTDIWFARRSYRCTPCKMCIGKELFARRILCRGFPRHPATHIDRPNVSERNPSRSE